MPGTRISYRDPCAEDVKPYFRCFDMVVKVVSERLDMRDVLCSSLRREMTREEDYSY
jgi:hypothetical protein